MSSNDAVKGTNLPSRGVPSGQSGRTMDRRTFLRAGAATALAGPASLAAARASAAPSRSSGQTTLRMWVWEEVSQWEQVISNSGLHQKFPHVKMEFTALNSSTLQQKLISALSTGISSGLPDICRISSDWYQQIVATKAVVETTSHVKGVKKELFPGIYQTIDLNGKTWAVPDDTGAVLMAYRVDLFQKAGLPTDPDQVANLWPTYDDYLNVGKELKAKTGASLTNVDPTQGGNFQSLTLQGSSGEFDAHGKVIFDDDYHVTAAETLKRVYDSGLVTTFSTANTGSPELWNAVKNGQFATWVWPNWEDFTVVDFAPDSERQWRVTYLPRVTSSSKRIANADGCLQIVPSGISSDRQKLALDVATYMRTNVKPLLSHMHTFSGAFVSYLPALDKMAGTPSPVLDGQSTYSWFLDAIKAEGMYPHYRTSVHFADAVTAEQNAIDAYLTKGGSASSALRGAANQIRSLQKSTKQQ